MDVINKSENKWITTLLGIQGKKKSDAQQISINERIKSKFVQCYK